MVIASSILAQVQKLAHQKELHYRGQNGILELIFTALLYMCY